MPLTIRLLIQDEGNACEPLANAAVYIWHCDREGRYSLYSSGVEDQNYLRGVQAAGADGIVTFTSIFPAAYSGRWPHVHFEVYPSIAAAADAGNKIATSQIALPKDDLRRGVRDRRLRAERLEHERISLERPTACSATTAARTSWARCRARWRTA